MNALPLSSTPPGPLAEFWHGFSTNRSTLAALIVFALLALTTLLAPWIAPHDPIQQFRQHMLTPPM